MTAENGNGELKQLLEIKRAYRKDLVSFEEDVRAKLERELADGKKRLKEQYLEKIVDTVFAEPPPSGPLAPVPVEVKTEPEHPPKGTIVLAQECPECGAPVHPEDKFCSRCAAPLTSLREDRTEHEVAIAGRRAKRPGR
jgi:hypothetical protein